jgi:hypothetical protein
MGLTGPYFAIDGYALTRFDNDKIAQQDFCGGDGDFLVVSNDGGLGRLQG